MHAKVNVYPSDAQAHYENLLAAIGGRPVEAATWVERRDVRRTARAARRGRRLAWRIARA
jgi:hypothetical protein